MGSMATVTSKGQITLPKEVRQALGVEQGDRLLFTVSDRRVFMEKNPSFLSLAGSIPVPEDRRGASWEEIMEHMRRERGVV